MVLQRVRHDLATKQQQSRLIVMQPVWSRAEVDKETGGQGNSAAIEQGWHSRGKASLLASRAFRILSSPEDQDSLQLGFAASSLLRELATGQGRGGSRRGSVLRQKLANDRLHLMLWGTQSCPKGAGFRMPQGGPSGLRPCTGGWNGFSS